VKIQQFSAAESQDSVCPERSGGRGRPRPAGRNLWQRAPVPSGCRFRTVEPQCAVAIEEIAKKLNDLGGRVIFLGDGVPVFQECLKGLMQTAYSFAPPHMNRQRAASIAALGCIYWKEGRAVKAGEHIPVYLRQSQAERERDERGGGTS